MLDLHLALCHLDRTNSFGKLAIIRFYLNIDFHIDD